MQENASQSISKTNFSRGACPRTPLAKLRACGARAERHRRSGVQFCSIYCISQIWGLDPALLWKKYEHGFFTDVLRSRAISERHIIERHLLDNRHIKIIFHFICHWFNVLFHMRGILLLSPS